MSFSKFCFYLCLSLLGGVFFSSFYNIDITFYFFALIIFLTMLVVLYKKEIILVGFCCLLFSFGVFWEEKFEREFSPNPCPIFLENRSNLESCDIHFFNEQGEVIFEGEISEEPKRKNDNTQIVINSSQVIIKEQRIFANGKALAILPISTNFQYGDKVLVRGRLRWPMNFTSGFNWREYLRKDRIYSIIYNPEIDLISQSNGNSLLSKVFSFKEKIIRAAKTLPPPEGAILEGIILGEEGRFSKSFKEKLSQSGLSHITAVSGMNITILFSLLFFSLIFLGFWRKEATIFSLLILIVYILLVGATPSAIRAGIMGIFLYFGYALGRLTPPHRLIVLTATLMIIQNPLILTRDIGFQLSFLAFSGLLYLSPLIEKLMKAENSLFKKSISQTLAAQVFCLPLLIFNFGRVPLMAPLSNILVLPLIPFLTIGGFLILILGGLTPSLANLSFILYPPLKWITTVTEITSALPFSTLSLNFSWKILFLMYLSLFIFIFWLRQMKNKR